MKTGEFYRLQGDTLDGRPRCIMAPDDTALKALTGFVNWRLQNCQLKSQSYSMTGATFGDYSRVLRGDWDEYYSLDAKAHDAHQH